MAGTAPERTIREVDRAASHLFAQVFRAYQEASGEVQEVIRELCEIVTDPATERDELDAAISTLAEALFPAAHDGDPGVDLEDVRGLEGDDSAETMKADTALEREEAVFAERLGYWIEQRGVTQSELAEKIGVGQPAISMMLKRTCRPQRRTVEKLAHALDVAVEELWPANS